ncbi:hypothetical protein E3N88_21344 [Mikania micrantha]|uniref:Myb/SANT-like domain-containing protein n=1 Tax=Mikania micrantha TaxID=192012 RepID=A0A5N6NJK1_9ASTR|nr:hypothetical protein E3N88_21344 [Mikania micrantha]
MGEKHQWSNEEIKCLLETCIEEINNVGKRGLSLHKDSWNKLGRVLKEKFGMDFSQKQLKNAFDNLKAKYIGWMYLKHMVLHKRLSDELFTQYDQPNVSLGNRHARHVNVDDDDEVEAHGATLRTDTTGLSDGDTTDYAVGATNDHHHSASHHYILHHPTNLGVLRATARPKIGANINLGCFYLMDVLCGGDVGGFGKDEMEVRGRKSKTTNDLVDSYFFGYQ